MAAAELLKNMSVDAPIPIFINNDTDIFLLNTYVRGYHKEGNEFDTTVVALIHNDSLK